MTKKTRNRSEAMKLVWANPQRAIKLREAMRRKFEKQQEKKEYRMCWNCRHEQCLLCYGGTCNCPCALTLDKPHNRRRLSL